MSVQINKDITTVQVEVPKTNVAIENAVTQITVQTSTPQITISQVGLPGRDGRDGVDGVGGGAGEGFPYSGSAVITGSLLVSGSTSFTIIGDSQFSGSLDVTGSIFLNGIDIASAVAGTSGTSGVSGSSGTSGTSGTSGVSGSSGTSGVSGSSGTSGINGTSGTSGISGSSGTSGTSGISGSAGTSGTSGTSGISGSSGTSGVSGTSGTSGVNGSEGTSGTSGFSIDSGSFATTGSNTFNGNQTINGSIILDNGAVIKDTPNNGISFGYQAAEINQSTQSVAIGNYAGYQNQSNQGIAIGANAGALNQGQRAVALGGLAGSNTQGEYAVAIGNFAAPNNQAANSIVISAIGTGLENTTPNSLVIAPIRNTNGDDGVLQYNNTTNEVSYATTLNGITNLATTGSNQFNGNQTITGSLIHGLEGNIATGEQSHAEGSITKAIGNYSHAEGDFTQAIGDYSHAEGQETIASGSYSHAEGYQTIALGQRQHVTGQYNFVSPVQSAFIVGNGIGDGDNRSNLIYAAENAVEITGSLNVLGNQTVNGSFTASLREGYVWVGANTGKNTLQISTSSFGVGGGADITLLNNYTGSSIGIDGGLMAYTASLKAAAIISSSAQITALGFGAGGGSDITLLNQFSGSVNTYTSSNDSVRNRILQTTASLNTLTGSVSGIVNGLMAYTSSVIPRLMQATASLNSKTGSFATTGSNQFNGNQGITGSLSVSSTLIISSTIVNDGAMALTNGSNLTIGTGSLLILSSSQYISGSIIPNTGAGTYTSSFSLGSATNAWKDIWVSEGSINFVNSLTGATSSISLNTTTNQIVVSNLNINTASLDSRIIAIETAALSASYFSSSIQLTGSFDERYTQTSSLNTFTSSINNYTGSSIEISNGLMAYTASLKAATIISGAAQITALGFGAGGGVDIGLLNIATASLSGTANGLMAYTASLKSTGLVSGSLIASSSYSVVSDNARTMLLYSNTQDFESYLLFSNAVAVTSATIAGNNNIRYNSSTNVLTVGTVSATKYLGGVVSSSAQLTELNTYTGSNDSVRNRVLQTTASLNTYTGSNDSVISRILQTTASLNTLTGSMSGVVNGLMALTASMKAAAIVSSSTQVSNYFVFAQTSSANTFYNNQTISGSLFVSSTAISNATLLAASSNLTLSSGSNLYIYNGGFADISGSLRLTGSLNIGFSSGTSEFQVRSTGVTIGNISTDRHLITGSLIVSASTNLTGSVTINESRIDNGWTAYTPQWTAASSNPAIGNGTIEGYYKVIGKTCFVRGNIAMGSTTTFGSGEWYVSMPFTASHADAILMSATLLDNGSAWYNATMNGARAGFNHKAAIQYQHNSNGTAVELNPTQPFTWTNGDRFIWNGSYEMA